MRIYEKRGFIPKEKSVYKVIERSFYVVGQFGNGKLVSIANKEFRRDSNIKINDVSLSIDASLYLIKFETKIIKRNLNKENKREFNPSNLY